MKKITVHTTPGSQINFLSEDDKADELKAKLEEGVRNLTSTNDKMYAWINVQNVTHITMEEHPKTEEAPPASTADLETNIETPK